MKSIVSTLFRVIHFPHDGNIVTHDQISFVSPDHSLTIDHLTFLNVPYMQAVSPPPQVHYVASCPIPSIANEKDPLTVFSHSLDLVLTVEMVTTSLGTLESILPHVDQSESLDMYSFESVIILSGE